MTSLQNTAQLTEDAPRPARSVLRRNARRIRGAHTVYRATQRVDREVTAFVHWLRAGVNYKLDKSAGSKLAAQSPTHGALPFEGALGRAGLEDALKKHGVAYAQCPSGVYVAPGSAHEGTLGELLASYPEDAGFKFVELGPLGGIGAARERFRAACALHAEGLAPTPYDAVELPACGLVAFVVQHVGGAQLANADLRALQARVKQSADAAGLAAMDDHWCEPHHYVVGDDGTPTFLGWDHFRVEQPDALVKQMLTRETRSDLHFGLEYKLRGGRYLYQSVPTVGAAGRRDSSRRWDLLSSLLASKDVSVEDRVVLDIGCNAGMMLAATLAAGAWWGVGWDRPTVVHRGTDLLYGLGFTRHQLVPGELGPDRRVSDDVPAHLTERLDGSIVLYLAIRHHIGWLKELGKIPWHALLYEGGESESVATLEDSLKDLRDICDFDVATAIDLRDSETRARPVALLIRR